MNMEDSAVYSNIRSGKSAVYHQERGLIAVWGKEAVQFLDGLVTNDMKTLNDGSEMLAAFPNAQGRLLAVVRVSHQREKFYIETEGSTKEALFQNLFRFTYAGDFFVEDLSAQYSYFESFGDAPKLPEDGLTFSIGGSSGQFVPVAVADSYLNELVKTSAIISEEVYETIRIENGTPLFGVDMDGTTIVPELGLDGLISYTKGCYIGQEIIARIHFRGHVAKRLTGLVLESTTHDTAELPGTELFTGEGKSAGRITSATISPTMKKTIALAYVRYEHLQSGTKVKAGSSVAVVTTVPFIS
ncbi:MAG: glycine cleavage T C-terminal barrel domain-containing protein [Acidobacteriota bacterium]